MKKKIFITTIMLSILLAITSCKKDNNDDNNIITNATMTATIDNNTWTSVTRVTKHYKNTSKFIITGTSVSGEVIVITIKGDQVGHYTSSASIDSASAQVGCVWQPDASSPTTDNYLSKSGTVDISSVDTASLKISGTFKFDLIKTDSLGYQTAKTITDGKFSDLSYSESDN